MPIAVLINGAFGRMGQIAAQAINGDDKLELVGQTGREYDLAQSIKDSNAQVVVDFTHPESVYENTKTIIEAGARPVIGTSGLTHPQVESLQTLAEKKKIGGLVVPNFSLGAVLLMKHAQEIVKYMPHVEIIEMHHPNKADSPSGTAIRSAELMAAAAELTAPQKPHETVKGSRGALYKNIPIHAVRLPGFLAHLQIIFGNDGETLTLTHDSIDRKAFMPGICLACERVMKLDRLLFGLEEIL